MDRPWFKFTANNWLSGSVQLLDAAEKGTYIDLIAMIWKEGGKLENSKILHRKLRLDSATACDRINSYCDLDILVCEDDFLSIKFLNDQINSYKTTCEKNAENAAKRWDKEPKPMRPDANKKRREEKREEEKRKELKNITKKFTAPTVEEVKEYCDKRLNSVDPDKFISHYETSGWMRGKTKIKDWQACVRTWEKNSSNTQAAAKAYYAGHSLSVLTAIVQKMNNHQANTKEIDIFMAASNDGFKPNE
jgi:hypothetical protein